MRALIAKLKPYERQLSALAMIGGFVFDNFAFGRIDHPATQAVFAGYLLFAGASIATCVCPQLWQYQAGMVWPHHSCREMHQS